MNADKWNRFIDCTVTGEEMSLYGNISLSLPQALCLSERGLLLSEY